MLCSGIEAVSLPHCKGGASHSPDPPTRREGGRATRDDEGQPPRGSQGTIEKMVKGLDAAQHFALMRLMPPEGTGNCTLVAPMQQSA
jgi:hypothetical protein